MPSDIKQRKNEKLKEEETETEKKSNWLAFCINVLQNFVMTLFIGVLGANFIFLSSSTTDFLEKILPTKETNYFPTLESQTKLFGGGGKFFKGGEGGENYKVDDKCAGIKNATKKTGVLESIGIGLKGGFPYKYKKTEGHDFINWMIETIYGSFSINRGWLQTWIGYFTKESDSFLSNDTFQIFLIAPITLMASILSFPLGFFTSLYSSFNTKSTLGLFWAVLGLIIGYNWIMAATISIVMFFQYLIFFMVIPLITNLTMIKKIVHCNVKTLGLLFGALVCSSAIAHLDYVTSSVMIVVYILLAIKTIFRF